VAANISQSFLHGSREAGGLLLSHSGPHLSVDMGVYGLLVLVLGLLWPGIRRR